MVWLPDHIWEAQKKAGKGGGGGKGWGSQSVKKDFATKTKAAANNDVDLMTMVAQLMKDPSKRGALEKLMNTGGAAAPGSGVGNAKMLLSQWVQTKTGEQSTKEQIVYTTTQVEDSKPPEFVCEVTIIPLDPSKSYKGKKSPSKKAAEAAAAEAALRQNGQGAVLKGSSLPAKAKATPAAPAGPGVGNAKMLLSQWVHSQTSEPVTKDQIVYTTTPVGDSKPPEFVCEVIILPLDPSKSYKGKKSPSKKAAEAAAAEAALRQNGQGAVLKGSPLPAKAKAKAKSNNSNVIQKLKGIDSSCKVWIGGLSEKTTQNTLSNHFAKFAKPKVVDLMKKGKAVAAYESEEEAAGAIAALNATKLDGNTIEVDVWTTK